MKWLLLRSLQLKGLLIKVFFIGLIGTLSSCAHQLFQEGQKNQILQATPPGSVLVIGEQHAFKMHNSRQYKIIQALIQRGDFVILGFELIQANQQENLNQFLNESLSTQQGLKLLNWPERYTVYLQMAKMVHSHSGLVFGLNAPRTLSRALAKGGLQGLSDQQKSQLPEGFQKGSHTYQARFNQLMGVTKEHVSTEQMFLAQSLWDDYMASESAKIKAKYPRATLVILTGDFHLAFEDGLVNRLKARGLTGITTISQFQKTMIPEKRNKESSTKRADFVFEDE